MPIVHGLGRLSKSRSGGQSLCGAVFAAESGVSSPWLGFPCAWRFMYAGCWLRLKIENRVHPGLAVLQREFPLDLVQIDRVHDDDVVRAVFAQECRRHDPLTGTGQKFADTVRIDVDRVLDLVAHPEGRQKRDGL